MTMPDPDTLDTAAVALHEMFQSYKRAGFNKVEALALISIHLQELLRKVPPLEDGER